MHHEENENGTSNGRGRGFLPLYTTTNNKMSKKGTLLNKINQGSKFQTRKLFILEKKEARRCVYEVGLDYVKFWKGL